MSDICLRPFFIDIPKTNAEVQLEWSGVICDRRIDERLKFTAVGAALSPSMVPSAG